ncbi:hypothetical protein [Sediminicoccus sp. KRV36]|uniref:hypothetical protein n=1 Tax=Sediminicoccus sp. KRV36 TaxID=3133721 RepID=UPI00200CBFDF|nr:hypothetical protein [Sediminicoccus rosea]UPY35489.1 hypothetical protein LHU95_14820 [Sediminicoccus rosea]
MIQSVAYFEASPSTRIRVVMEDGSTYFDDLSHPPDTWLRGLLVAWMAENTVTPFEAP